MLVVVLLLKLLCMPEVLSVNNYQLSELGR